MTPRPAKAKAADAEEQDWQRYIGWLDKHKVLDGRLGRVDVQMAFRMGWKARDKRTRRTK